MFLMSKETIAMIIAAALALLTVLIIVFFLYFRKPKGVKIDEEFINNLLNILGGNNNIKEVSVDNGRLKFLVDDLDKVNLNSLKEVSTSGVFVTGNVIKTLFKLDSQTIKKAIEERI